MPNAPRNDETPSQRAYRRNAEADRERRRAGYRFYKRTNEQINGVFVIFGMLLVGAVLVEAVKLVLGLFGIGL